MKFPIKDFISKCDQSRRNLVRKFASKSNEILILGPFLPKFRF